MFPNTIEKSVTMADKRKVDVLGPTREFQVVVLFFAICYYSRV